MLVNNSDLHPFAHIFQLSRSISHIIAFDEGVLLIGRRLMISRLMFYWLY